LTLLACLADDSFRIGELVTELLDAVDAHPMSAAKHARRVNVSPSTLSRWRAGAEPRLLHLIALAYSVGLRLEWQPQEPTWPGVDLPPTKGRPEPEEWWSGSWVRGVEYADHKGVSWSELVYYASLLGAEARWARTHRMGWSLAQCPGSRHAWADFENGPDLLHIAVRFDRQKRREYRSSPLRTAVFVGRHLGLDLTWRPLTDPWRVRPWLVPGPAEHFTPGNRGS